ncbi:TniB family NTP-binding protein [Thalassotalea psychrophila]|uniref:TniB family NTP-binding protein n=1 Tax=Thalassotalea psychrophila TaxID=3065647 RepID=A0ABY9TT61_9GAMM|nr:TniB family NTP-binding protein [Colwelliaceae bacterium SQ149]
MSNFELKPETIAFKKRYSMVERYQTPISLIENTIKYRELETSGLMIVALSGSGKSRMTEYVRESNEYPYCAHKDHKFGIYVEAPGTSMSGFLTAILTALGDPKPSFGDLDSQKSRIITLIGELDVKVVFLDEIQVILPSSGLLPTSKVVKILKELINKTSAAWVLMGTPEAAELIEVDTQLKDRFNRLVTIPAFGCCSNEDALDFIEYLFDILESFPRKLPYFTCLNESLVEGEICYIDSVNYDNLLRFCLATNGKARGIANLLMECVEQTAENKAVTRSVLSSAFNSRFKNDANVEIDPFTASIKKVKDELKKRGLYA